ncbi:MAG: hypothetical protein ACYC6Y_03370 [Thermoguttaceae bacterium]
MVPKFARPVILAALMLAALSPAATGCRPAKVEYPENPTPPPRSDPVSASAVAPDRAP